jgi:hypothetical protein
MNEINQTLVWVGSIKWKLHEFVVEAELERDLSGWYCNEIRNLYWNDKATNSSKEIIDLFVDTLNDKQYDELTAAIVAAYLDSKQKGE